MHQAEVQPVSNGLEAKLTAYHELRIVVARSAIEESQYHLSRIAMIYGGQLTFDFGEHYEPRK